MRPVSGRASVASSAERCADQVCWRSANSRTARCSGSVRGTPGGRGAASEIDSAPLAVRLLKRSLYQGAGWNPRQAAWHEAFAQSATLQTEDAREGIRALLEKREPLFEGR